MTQLGWLRLFRGLVVVALSGSVLAGAAAQSAAAQSLPGAGWSPATGALGDDTYQGFVDHPSAGQTLQAGAPFQVSGWVVDTTAQGWSGIDDVQVMLGGQTLGHLSVGQSRPDVASLLNNPYYANSGFSGTISSPLPTGSQTLTVVAHTPDKGSWSKQVPVTVTGSAQGALLLVPAAAAEGLILKVISPTTSDVIPSRTSAAIYGVAYDTRTRPELGTGVDRVSAYLDGPRGTAGSQSLGDATWNGDNWSITWDPTKFDSVKHHVLWVYAHSTVTGEEVLFQEEINLS
ncbi:MAG: hypothetical protein JO057_29235 [Chloroflexi bacterium]|nr:hypothetical protein [Chloroflexota bacterium]